MKRRVRQKKQLYRKNPGSIPGSFLVWACGTRLFPLQVLFLLYLPRVLPAKGPELHPATSPKYVVRVYCQVRCQIHRLIRCQVYCQGRCQVRCSGTLPGNSGGSRIPLKIPGGGIRRKICHKQGHGRSSCRKDIFGHRHITKMAERCKLPGEQYLLVDNTSSWAIFSCRSLENRQYNNLAGCPAGSRLAQFPLAHWHHAVLSAFGEISKMFYP